MKYIELAKQLIAEGWDYIGVRACCPDERYNVGDTCRESYEWDIEHDCSTYELHGDDGEKAGGTCCTVVATWADNINDPAELAGRIDEAVQKNSMYKWHDGQQVVVAGNKEGSRDVGILDDGEIRIVDAVVVGVIV